MVFIFNILLIIKKHSKKTIGFITSILFYQFVIIKLNKDTTLIGWNAVYACIIASIIGITVEVGIPTINSLLAACIIYGLLSKIKR
ncbi:hypothetical protein BBD39_00340 [Arsenophonus endosymbiont of Bemisia tabaci Asia II 3]|nr:hypothetical protein BBD39_00340 [Arsenophonus endosymbiont of Bemisia tabaci Asia II 3]